MEDAALETSAQPAKAVSPFGTQFADQMTLVRYSDGRWSDVETVPVGPLPLHRTCCITAVPVLRG
ncbi:hypothetical protein ACTXGQ_11295 [Marinobacter sp. 1Y8]